MNRLIAILIGFVLAGVVFGYFGWQAVKPDYAGTTAVVPVRADILNSDVSAELEKRDVNGKVPVTVDLPADFGRDDPFAPL